MKPFKILRINKSPIKSIQAYELAVSIAESGRIGDAQLVSATCTTHAEIDHEVDKLIKNLEDLRKSAKQIMSNPKDSFD